MSFPALLPAAGVALVILAMIAFLIYGALLDRVA
jgi:hypothetical protein